MLLIRHVRDNGTVHGDMQVSCQIASVQNVAGAKEKVIRLALILTMHTVLPQAG
jgi:hypothetical protein